MGHFLPISFGLNSKNAPIRSGYVNIALGGLFLAQVHRRGASGVNVFLFLVRQLSSLIFCVTSFGGR
ncbi:MAG: hypothetical protein COA32_14940 [Fluviicola sp.]|nr:MAG: hypothetical protein COA32_14940 [Fluviicola sp.]